MVEKVLAGVGLAVCVLLLVWTLLGPRRRGALAEIASRTWHWRSHRRQARQQAAQAIERARRPIVDREGNVYRPKSFNGRSGERRDH